KGGWDRLPAERRRDRSDDANGLRLKTPWRNREVLSRVFCIVAEVHSYASTTTCREDEMATWQPDPSFYPSPRLAAKARPETLAYVAAFDPSRQAGDAIATVDLDPASASYSQILNTVPVANAGDEFHHFGWNACSSCLCPNAPHPHVERRYLVVPG